MDSSFGKYLRLAVAIAIFVLFLNALFLLVPIFIVTDLVLHLCGYKTWVSEDEVYETLSSTVWKTGAELKAEIHANRLKSQSFSLVCGDLYPVLARLEDANLVERRVRILNEEQRNLYGSYSRQEYRCKPNSRRPKRPSRRKWFELPELNPAF